MSRKPNADVAYHYAASQLSQHLKSCNKCSAALKSDSGDRLCASGAYMACEAAKRFRTATNARWWRGFTKTQHEYLCPDPDSHGHAFTYTATPVFTVAEQPELF